MEAIHLTNDWLALIGLALPLGMKHGLDPDHLATIDSWARFNGRHNKKVARWSGFLFSGGHGTVIIAISLVAGTLSGPWTVPHWTEAFGAWISIGILTLLGLVNLRAVLRTPTHEVVHSVGIKGRFLGRLQQTDNPLIMFGIGALFALSFETISQISLYALVAAQFGGWRHALALSAVFTFGMIATDGINGMWVSHLIHRSDQFAPLASRVMGLTVALLSLGVAAMGLAQNLSPSIAAWSDGKAPYFGWGIIAVIAVSFAVGLGLAHRRNPNSSYRSR
ncbi:MAG TPA: hypothetical protein VNE82_22940 [Candidatus Binataceae bacterium]|nr:hypothetical protein [Candidatus Binataceae bacterium]